MIYNQEATANSQTETRTKHNTPQETTQEMQNEITMENMIVYSHDVQNECMVISHGEKSYLFDYQDFCKVLNYKKNFTFEYVDDIYPSYGYNAKRITYLEFLYLDGDIENYKFQNGNKYDLRKSNVNVIHKKDEFVKSNYEVIEYINGHYPKYKHSNVMKNPLWRVKINGEEKILMYCETDTLCILCPESYAKVCDYEKNYCNGNKLTFHKGTNGYIMAHNTQTTYLTIHQIIMQYYGFGKGTKDCSIDHIDRNRLNNCIDNLQIVGNEIQQQNKKGTLPNTKRERQYNARKLPDGIEQSMLRKYVVYYLETYNKEKKLTREYFRVEHSNLPIPWETTKSNKVSIMDKLEQANQVAENLEKGIMPTKEERELPKYFTIDNSKATTYLMFDRRKNGIRYNMRIPIIENSNMDNELEKIKKLLIEKYEDQNIYNP